MVKQFFPFLDWFSGYNAGKLKLDFFGGLTVAMVLIPQSIAYAQLIGLPPYYGLYAAFLPPIVAALFGRCSQINTGPVAVVSLMVSTALEPLATAGSEEYLAYAVLLALVVGVFQLSLGLLRLGMIVNLLSHPVVNGFTNAAAIIIATSQLANLLGVQVDNAKHHYETLFRVYMAAKVYVHLPTFGMSALAIITILIIKRINKRIPAVLAAVVLTTLISWATGYEKSETVSIDNLEAPAAVREITRLDNMYAEYELLARDRVKLASRYREITGEHKEETAEGLGVASEIEIAEHHMENLREEINALKAVLRSFMFEKSGEKEGGPVFRIRRAGSDAPVWRLSIGKTGMDPGRITIMSGGQVVGSIPGGLPDFHLPSISLVALLQLFPMAAVIAILGFMETISVAKFMATRTGSTIDTDQELIAQGAANITGFFSSGFAVSGSFARTAVNYQSGSATGMANIFSSVVVLVVMLFLTKYFYFLPKAALAAIVMMAVVNLVDIEGFIHIWKAKKFDGLVALVTFITTLIFAPHLDRGIIIGVGMSMAYRIFSEMHPELHLLSKHRDGSFKPADIYHLKPCRHIAVVKFNDSLFYENVAFLEHSIIDIISMMPDLKHIVIAAKGINELDASGEAMLSVLVPRIREMGCEISFSGVNDEVMKVLKNTGLYDDIGKDHFFNSVQETMNAIHAETHQDSDEERCPLMEMVSADKEDLPLIHVAHKGLVHWIQDKGK